MWRETNHGWCAYSHNRSGYEYSFTQGDNSWQPMIRRDRSINCTWAQGGILYALHNRATTPSVNQSKSPLRQASSSQFLNASPQLPTIGRANGAWPYIGLFPYLKHYSHRNSEASSKMPRMTRFGMHQRRTYLIFIMVWMGLYWKHCRFLEQ